MGFQVAGRCRPLSKFMEFLQDLILMASVAHCPQYPLADLSTLVFPQSIRESGKVSEAWASTRL